MRATVPHPNARLEAWRSRRLARLPGTEGDAIPVKAAQVTIPQYIADIEPASATGCFSVQDPSTCQQQTAWCPVGTQVGWDAMGGACQAMSCALSRSEKGKN